MMKKTVLVTGAAKRIGREIAKAFAISGWNVVIHFNRSEKEADELLAELGGLKAGHSCVRCDFSDIQAVAALIPSLERPIDCLVNNASVYSRVLLKDTTPEILQEVFAVNFLAPFELMRSFAIIRGRGCIINITDQRVAAVDPDSGPYGLAKKALMDATEAAALDWAPAIRVNAVAPGIVISPPGVPPEKMQRLLPLIPMQTNSTPEDIASACLFLANSDNITGQTLFVDGGMHLQGYPLERRRP